jgi:hypothetical protein
MFLLRTEATQVALTENIFSFRPHETEHGNWTVSSRVVVTLLSCTAPGLLLICISFETVLKINSANAFCVSAKSKFGISLQFDKISRSEVTRAVVYPTSAVNSLEQNYLKSGKTWAHNGGR